MIKAFSQLIEKYYDEFNNANSQYHYVALISIILVAFTLRMLGVFQGQGYHYFAIGDELAAYRVALDFIAGDAKAYYLGQPTFSNGHVPGPFWTLFWVFLLKVGGNSIQGAIIIMTLINVAVVYLFYIFSRKFFNPVYSLYSTLFFATAPWPIYFSSGVWNPLPLALLGVVLFISLWNVTQTNNSRHIFVVCLLAAVIPQFHMIGIFYIPAILLLLYISPIPINRRWFVAGVVAGTAVYLPYLIGDALNNWENTQSVLGAQKRASASVFKILTAPLNVLSNLPARWAGEGYPPLRDFGNAQFGSVYFMLFFNLLSVAISITIASSFIKKLFNHIRENGLNSQSFSSNASLVFIGILLVIPPLLYLVTGHNYASRYTILVFPLLFLFPPLYLKSIATIERKSRFVLLTIVIMLFNIFLTSTFYSYQEDKFENANFFMPSISKMEKLRDILVMHAGENAIIKINNSAYIDDTPKEKHLVKNTFPAYVNLSQLSIKKSGEPLVEKTYYLVQLEKYDIQGLDVIYQGNGIALTLQKPLSQKQ